jgi:hypothetical protein
MNTNEIFQKISENIIVTLQSYKKKESSLKSLNENLLLNVSSMSKFLSNKQNLNHSTLDVVIPISRFQQNIENKIKAQDQDLGLCKGISGIEESFFKDIREVENNDFGLNPNESIFSQTAVPSDNLNQGNNNQLTFDDNVSYLNKTEISTIYNYKENESVIDQSFHNFVFNKLRKSTESQQFKQGTNE